MNNLRSTVEEKKQEELFNKIISDTANNFIYMKTNDKVFGFNNIERIVKIINDKKTSDKTVKQKESELQMLILVIFDDLALICNGKFRNMQLQCDFYTFYKSVDKIVKNKVENILSLNHYPIDKIKFK